MTQEIPHSPPSVRPSWSRQRLVLGLAGLLLAGGGYWLTRPAQSKDSKSDGKQAIPVTVATAFQKTVPVQISAIGHVQAASTVAVTPQVGGQITGLFFQKGQEVHKGQLLFTIDNRSETAALQQAQGVVAKDQAGVQQARANLLKDQEQVQQARANLLKDQAQSDYAVAESQRYNNLYQQGAISQEQTQQYSTSSRAAAATLKADQEAIATAQAQLQADQAAIANAQAAVSADSGTLNNQTVQSDYTKVYAPIDGRAGNVLVTVGNVVQPNGSPLVVIEQVRPIQVSFALPESNLTQVQQQMQNGKLPVTVSFSGSNRTIAGVLSFVNNTVDDATGTIQLMGDFDNAQGQLYPGQFVNTTLTLAQQPNATVVPAQAVQNGPNGQFVFVVKPDQTVENVAVTATSTVGNLDVIQKGIQPGVQVVTDGQANLVTGSQVRVQSSDANASSTPSGGQS